MAASSITKIPLDVSHVYSQAEKITRISTAISNNNSWTNVASSPTPKMESAYTSVGDKYTLLEDMERQENVTKIV